MVGGKPGARGAATHQDGLLTALCAAIAVGLGIVATWQGPGLSIDSVNYLSTGINLADGRGLLMLHDQALTIFPPGVPILAAAGELVGIGGEPMLRVVSVASFGAMVLLGNALLRRVVDHRGVVLGATALLAVAVPLLTISKMAWSEPPFIVVTLLFLLALGDLWERGTIGRRDVVRLAALVWVAFVIRYVGISLLGVGGLAMLLAVRPLDRRALGRIASFGLLSLVVPVACMARNNAADGSLLGKYLGNRVESRDTIGDVALHTGSTLGRWIVPGSGPATRPYALLGLVAVVLVLIGLVATLRRRRPTVGTGDTGPAPTISHLACCAIYVFVYAGYLTAAALWTSFEPVNLRYLAPVYVPGVVVAAAGVETLLARTRGATWTAAVGAVAGLLIAVQLVTSVGDAREGAADGIGFNKPVFVDSPLAVAAVPFVEAGDAVVYSNQPHGLWSPTRMQPVRWAPRDIGFRGAELEGEVEAFATQVACTAMPSYLVYYLYAYGDVVGLEEIEAVVDVEQVAVAPGVGAVFELTSAAPADCPDDWDPSPSRIR
jgi:hypothetical protein